MKNYQNNSINCLFLDRLTEKYIGIKKYTVYKILNVLNCKIYIGVHETYNINDKYMGSGYALKRAQKKY